MKTPAALPWTCALLVSALLLAACGDDGGNPTPPSNNAAPNNNTVNNGSNNTPTNNGSNNAPTNNGTVNNDNNNPDAPFACGAGAMTVASGSGAELTLEGAAQGDLAGLNLFVPAGVVPADTPLSATCVAEQSIVPEGFIPVSAAVALEGLPGVRGAAMKLRLPFRAGKMPAGTKGAALRVFVRFPDGSVRAPAFVDLQEDLAAGTLELETRVFGTYQVALPADAGQTYQKDFVFRAITGVSMGAGGAALIGFRNPDKFDAIGALGGPVDWTYLVHYLDGAGTGGFCPEADPGDPTTWKCDTYTPTEEFEHGMELDNWYYSTGEGTGGSFDRDSYLEILQDLTYSFGNITSYNPDSPFLPAGMPMEERQRPWAERCPTGGATIPTGYYDDEYNPDGSLPVIAFCEGTSNDDKTLPFDRYCDTDPEDGTPDQPNRGYYPGGEVQRKPMEIAFAVDYNGNGMRDRGEPIIRNLGESYEDTGADGLASDAEPGFDPISNPDPAGDDYHWAYNPFGTEGNWRHDAGEPYEDFGLDGVQGTPQLDAGGYDYGEGNGQFDMNPNLEGLYSRDPRGQMATWTDPEKARRFRNLSVFSDGGIRDIFNFAVATHQMVGAMQGHGANVRIYDDFTAMTRKDSYTEIDPTRLDFSDLGDHIMVRYGDPEADNEAICLGDGKHVGEIFQAINRLLLMVGYIINQFPNDGRKVCNEDADCSVEEVCLNNICGLRAPYATATGNFAFASPAVGGRYRYSIALPPGYEVTQCVDGVDNDGDGKADGDDPDCVSGEHNNEGGPNTLPRCADGLDNDLDGNIDHGQDVQCASATDDAESDEFEGQTYPVVFVGHGYGQGPADLAPSLLVLSGYMGSGFWPKAILVFPDGFCGETVKTQCNDGVDNDGDGMADRRDPDCANNSMSESGEPVTICNDGVDNDLDGLADFGADKGCDRPEDNDEANCVQGTFYTNHTVWPDGSTPGPAYEDALLELIEHLDANYRTRPPETVEMVR